MINVLQNDVIKKCMKNSRIRYFIHLIFPSWFYAYSTKVRIPASKVDFRKFLVAKYALMTGGTAIDVGAHVGYYTRYLAEIIGNQGNVYAFEPNPYVFSLLTKYTRSKENIKATQKAVSDIGSQSLDFYLIPYSLEEDSTLEYSIDRSKYKKIRVETIALDDLLKQNLENLKFIKIDVEGHEKKVIDGANKIIQKFRPYIIFEHCLSSMQLNPITYFFTNGYRCLDLTSLKFLGPSDITELTDVFAFPQESEIKIIPLIKCLEIF